MCVDVCVCVDKEIEVPYRCMEMWCVRHSIFMHTSHAQSKPCEIQLATVVSLSYFVEEFSDMVVEVLAKVWNGMNVNVSAAVMTALKISMPRP